MNHSNGGHPELETLEPIAVIGLSCRLPGTATNAQKFWELLENGGSSWSSFPKERFNDAGFLTSDLENHKAGTTNTQGGHFLQQDPGAFDASFFGIHAVEASAMDPQQRMVMEIAYEAFENAGITKEELWGSDTSVYVGQWSSDYHEILARDTELPPTYMTTGTGPAITSNRISYQFNLKGPSFTLDTGCSASLVALHQAIQSLRSGESSRSFVAGVNLTLDVQRFIYQSRLKMFSKEGRSFPFDSRANGYGRGEGCSGVVLEPLSSAVKRGAPIRAIIRNSVINSDGRTPGISVPSAQAQADAIKKAYAQLGLQVSADYVEAHGTGTRIGDPIEAKAISEAFCSSRSDGLSLPMGSLKGNIGHLESAAGLTALVKGVLMLENGKIPPQVNFERVNENIQLEKLGLRIPLKAETANLQRISINSFGYGGTNAHVILQSKPADGESNGSNHEVDVQEFAHPSQIFVLSATSEISCKMMAKDLVQYLDKNADGSQSDDRMLDAIAHTLSSRSLFSEYRTAAIAADVPELKKKLEQISEISLSRSNVRGSPRTAFVFSGQGAQYFNMGRELFGMWPTFTDSLNRAGKVLAGFGCSWDTIAELNRTEKESRVGEPEIAQSLSTAIQIALVDVMRELGVMPSFVVGHSSGEIAAAYCASLLSFEDALRISYQRGRLTSKLLQNSTREPGAMLAVGTAPGVVQDVIDQMENSSAGKLKIACYNSPESVTVSGDEVFVQGLQHNLEQRGIFNRLLRTGGAAYHSHQMLQIQEDYSASLQGIRSQPGSASTIMVSSLTGKEIVPGDSSLDSDYWVRNLVSPVLFSAALKKMATTQRGLARVDIIQEIGAHTQLEGPIKQTLRPMQNTAKITYVGTLKRGVRADLALLSAVRSLFTAGAAVNLRAANQNYKRTVPRLLTDLPSYPFDHSKSYWHESRMSKVWKQRKFQPHELLGVPALGSNAVEPKWRRYLRLDEASWLRGHVVQGQIVFPGAGYIAMAMEAIQQSILNSHPAAKFEEIVFKNISFDQALVLSDDKKNVEVSLSLRPETQSARNSSKTWQEMRIFSVMDNNNWIEHCRALVSIKIAAADGAKSDEIIFKTPASKENSEIQSIADGKLIKAEKFYYTSKQLGLDWGHPFDNLSSVQRNSTSSLAVIQPSPSTMSQKQLKNEEEGEDRREYWIHPALLDSCLFHGLYAILTAEDGFNSTVVPTFIKELTISGRTARQQDAQLSCFSTRTSASSLSFDVNVYGKEAHISPPLISATGVRATRVSGTQSTRDGDRTLVHTLNWVPHMDYVSKAYIERQCKDRIVEPGNIVEKNSRLNGLAAFYIQQALNEVSLKDIPEGHRRHWYSWMKHTMQKSAGVMVSSREETYAHYGDDPAFGAISRFGPNLKDLLKGTIDPISLLLEDDILRRIYSEERCRRCNAQIAAYCAEYAQQRPHMKILEIGAGSASASLPILEALRDSNSSKRVMASKFVFTDISAAFFNNAKDVLADFEDTVSYQVLNIEEDPADQGFELGSYDLIIASNVIHATKSISTAVANATSLLRPGGKFILMEITEDQLFYNFIFGSFEGWWAGNEEGRVLSPLLSVNQWGEKFELSGLENVKPVFQDYLPSEGGSINVFIANSKYKKPTSGEGETLGSIKILTGSTAESTTSTDMVQKLQLQLENVRLSDISAEETDHKISVLLPDVCDRLGSSNDLSHQEFEDIKRHILSSEFVILVSGSLDSQTQASGSLIKGFCQCLRMELPEIRFATLELACALEKDTTTSVAQALITMMQSPVGDNVEETDFRWDGRDLFVSRLLPHPEMNSHMDSTLGLLPPQMADFTQPNRILMAEPAIPGLVETIRWKDDPQGNIVGPYDVKLQLRAASINFKDVLIASGQLEGITEMQNDCSGIVVEVGSNMAKNFSVGDRVCALYSRSYTNYPIVHGDCVHKIPDNMTFEDAASIPIVWITVYHCLADLGRLKKGESILVHSAAGAVGQATIMLARHIGAEVFATVSTEAKKRVLVEQYGMAEDHIFSSRNVSFQHQIMKATNGRGVDVVLNFLSGDMFRASCNVVAKFGRFVEIGRKDLMNDALMPMEFLLRNITFAYADLALVITENKPLAKRLLGEVLQLVNARAISTVPIQVMPISEIETAFRTLQASKHTGKLILTVQDDQKVKIVPESPVAPSLESSAAYLVIGGLGGLGRRICTWLADRGAKNIIVSSRSIEKSDAGHSMVEAMRRQGVSLTLKSCDVSSEEQVKGLISSVQMPIRGVIQAAMVLQDALFEAMDVDKWLAAIDPKIKGTWNLHQYLPKDMDFFVMLSSIVAVSGNLGQSNYAAACSFQDSLARYRTSLGLAAHSINVGVVAEDGFVSENPAVAAALKKQGFDTIAVREFLAHLDYVVKNPLASSLSLSQSSLGLAPATDNQDAGKPGWASSAKFAHFYQKGLSAITKSGGAADIVGTILSLTKPEDIVSAFSNAILKQLSKLIDMALENLSAARSLDSYGVDSLVAVELRNWIGAVLQANIPLLTLRNTESITELAELVTRDSRITAKPKNSR